MTDQQWLVIEPLLPAPRRGRPRVHRLRLVLDTIWYVLRTGCAWRLVPNDLAPWHAAYRCFRAWTAHGVWADIHDALRAQVRTEAGRHAAPTAAVLDSQLVMTLGVSRFMTATMIPSRQAGDILSGMWKLITQVRRVTKTLVWDRESAIGGTGRLTAEAAAFAGTLATQIKLAPKGDPEFKGMVERSNGFLETSFLPGRYFHV